ncbi:hypothetical protein [Nocardia sp. NPDC020380]|uniref:hypothetical protein n=1 Tax=Nocardia sp. NPDC020380 TaxID=3364309 RepID=UPI00379F33E1
MTNNRAWASAAALAVLLAAGCGGGNGDSGTSATAPAPSTPREQLVLTEQEFPAESKKLDIPQDKLQATAGDFEGMMATTTVQPAECQSPQQDLSAATKAVLSKSATSAATTDKLMLVDFVSGQVFDLQKMADTNKKCAEVTTSATVDDNHVDGTTKIEKLNLPAALSGTDAIAYRVTSTAKVGDSAPITTTSYQGWATLRSTTVGVRATSFSGGVDDTTFHQVFATAVKKVRDAK